MLFMTYMDRALLENVTASIMCFWNTCCEYEEKCERFNYNCELQLLIQYAAQFSAQSYTHLKLHLLHRRGNLYNVL